MEDLRVAKVIIQTIIGRPIEEIEITPRERTAQIPSLGLSVFRLDFSAVVLTEDGKRRNVLIELQKAEAGSDIRRFRRYLAENYYAESHAHHPRNRVQEDSALDDSSPVEPTVESTEIPPVLPIISIYILGYPLPGLRGHSAVSISRSYRDSVTGEEIPTRVDFIECLTHDSFVIQISELRRRRRNKLEKMLSLFEQINLQANEHLKEFSDKIPGEFKHVLERLRQAALDQQILSQMRMEDEVLTAWKDRELQIEKALAEAKTREEEAKAREEEERRLKEEALAELADLKAKLGFDSQK